MNRYLLTFTKTGNMRFISHLDIQTLFQRALKRGNVKVSYSHGYNPHELMNIVSPLSLGYESLGELVEIDTDEAYDCEDFMERLNRALPQGIKFIACREVERKNQNTSIVSNFAIFEACFAVEKSPKLNIGDFLSQDIILIEKRDKKTKQMVEKDVKNMVYGIEEKDGKLLLKLGCASNATVNPTNLIAALFRFSGLSFNTEECRITRLLIDYDEK